MQLQHLQLETVGQALIIRLDRPKALNAIDSHIMDGLAEVFVRRAVNLDGIAGIIITGQGNKAFAAGADIKEFPTMDGVQGEALAKKGHDVYDAIEAFHLPVIAVVNGYALGGGCELTMACHMRIAEPNAVFGQPEVNLGVVPGYGGSQRLKRYIGVGRATRYLLTGDMIKAEQAREWGLVDEIADAGKAMDVAQSIVAKVASKSPLVVQRLLDLVHTDGKEGFDLEIELFGRSFDSNDLKEGVDAFINKRKPSFTGS